MVSVHLSVCPSICLSHLSIAAAACSGFAAVGRQYWSTTAQHVFSRPLMHLCSGAAGSSTTVSSRCEQCYAEHCRYTRDILASIATSSARYCLFVCLCAGHNHKHCKNGLTHWNASPGQTHMSTRNHILIRWGVHIPQRELGRSTLGETCAQYLLKNRHIQSSSMPNAINGMQQVVTPWRCGLLLPLLQQLVHIWLSAVHLRISFCTAHQ